MSAAWTRLLLSALLAATLTLGLVGWRVSDADPAPSVLRAAQDSRPEIAATAVLHAWDARRARAWRLSAPELLSPLYVAGSRTGRHDHAMLTAYADRGLHVVGMRMQVLAVEVHHRSTDRMVLVVTDRLARAVAVDPLGRRVALPSDLPSTRVMTWRRVSGEWRVDEVRFSGVSRRARRRRPPKRRGPGTCSRRHRALPDGRASS